MFAFPGTVILKAFTKMYAMAGIRLGYALCADRQLILQISQTGQAWSVSSPASSCGIAALTQRDFVQKTKRFIAEERNFLQKELENLGLQVYAGKANYLLFQAPTDDLPRRLERFGILIRSCGNYRGMDNRYCRVAVKSREDNTRLINGIRQVLKTEPGNAETERGKSGWQRQL